jgi:PAS domain S-box-containing protein
MSPDNRGSPTSEAPRKQLVPQHGPIEPLDMAAIVPLLEALTRIHETVLLVDGAGRIAWRSESLARLCGKRTLEASPWRDLVMSEGEADQVTEKLTDQGRLVNEPVKVAGVHGDLLPFLVTAVPLTGRRGQGPVIAILRRADAESDIDRELRSTTAYLQAVLESSPDAVLVADRGGFITYANSAVEALLGHPAAELLTKPLALFLHGQDDLRRIADAFEVKSPVHRQDLELRHRNGTPICVSLSASPLRVADGTHAGTVAFLRDVTEQRRAEEALARKNAELEHYVHAISHDLRSPLVSLLGFSRLLREDYGDRLEDRGRHFLDRIEQAGRSMESLIHHLLELSRIGQGNEKKSLVDPREVLLHVRAELKARIDAADIELEIPEDPPLVLSHRTRLYQVLANLMGNAVQHMGRRAGARIVVEIVEETAHHRITVRDNGCGIDPAHHERIFQLFESLPRDDGQRSTGMGLAIVRKVVEIHGGSCSVESAPGAGAAFHVLLPRS